VRLHVLKPLLGTAVAAWFGGSDAAYSSALPAHSSLSSKATQPANLGIDIRCNALQIWFSLVSDRSLLSRNPTPNRSNDQGAAAGSLGVMEKPHSAQL